MSLKYALLGFLNYQPMTGYELKKFVDTSVADFWSGELSQIYSTLKQLEADSLAEVNVEVQTDRPNRKVYSITPRGRAAFSGCAEFLQMDVTDAAFVERSGELTLRKTRSARCGHRTGIDQ